MRDFLLLAVLFSTSIIAGESVHDVFEVPAEFSEEEVQKEVLGNREASMGKLKVNSIEVDWSPEHTVLRGKPKKLKEEMQAILKSLRAYPLFAPLAKHVKLSDDEKTLDLTLLLKELNRVLPENCRSCFAIPLCGLKAKSKLMHSDDLERVLQGSHVKTKHRNSEPGAVVLLRENFSNKMPLHTYIWLSPTLAFERRGSGALLIRPQEVTEKEYKELASYERKYHKFVYRQKLPSLSSPMMKEVWVSK